MSTRTYDFALRGRLTVDDTALKAPFLAMELVPEPGVDFEVTDEWRLALDEKLLAMAEGMSPTDRLRTHLSAGPLTAVQKRLIEVLDETIPGAVAVLDGIEVTEVGPPAS